MKSLLFIIAAYITGFLAAVPTGPVQVEVIRRSVSGHIYSSFMVILGALIADTLYGIVAFFGIAPFLRQEQVMAVFWLIGSAVMIILAVLIIRNSRSDRPLRDDSRFLRKKRWGLVGGFSLSVTNPMMILWWLIGAKLFTDIRLIDAITPDAAISFVAAGVSGLASYLVVLALILFWVKHFIAESKIRGINFAAGCVLLLIAGYFLYASLHQSFIHF